MGTGSSTVPKTEPDGAFEYNYDPANVSQPYLRDGVMEVAVW